jgi:dTDP-4-amino-4,6-dideoxy-D-galactose acyltransferase
VSYESVSWDSEFFGFPIGRIGDDLRGEEDLRVAVTAADADGVRCLYFLCPSEADGPLQSALALGFRPYDVRIELECRLEGAPGPPAVRDARPAETPALEQIAREQLRGTRFWSDPRFPRERVGALYVEWLRRGLSTAPERRTLVAGEAEGFTICRFDRDRDLGTIELIAVAAASEGRGLGGELVAAAGHAFGEAGLARATVVTQGRNVGAQRLYQRYGYRTARVGLWLHRWSDVSSVPAER